MNKFFHTRVLTPFAALLLAIVCIGGTALACLYQPASTKTDAQLYRAAVLDAMTVDADEVVPLVTITPESRMVTWQDGKVLLLTVNSHPDRYTPGKTITVPEEIWMVTDREMAAWFATHKNGVTDWPRRLKQLVGVPPDGVHTHVTALWVLPQDILRPAFTTDITTPAVIPALPQNVSEEYKHWFERTIIWSYFTSAYPWTRLGYTYDWAENSGEYGLTEFLVRPGAVVTVASTETIAAFIQRLGQGR